LTCKNDLFTVQVLSVASHEAMMGYQNLSKMCCCRLESRHKACSLHLEVDYSECDERMQPTLMFFYKPRFSRYFTMSIYRVGEVWDGCRRFVEYCPQSAGQFCDLAHCTTPRMPTLWRYSHHHKKLKASPNLAIRRVLTSPRLLF
jgi:hypothetical protein